MIYEFKGIKPVIHPSAFVHPLASVIGNVIIGKDVYIGPGASLRGDFGQIQIQDGCNVQDNCTIHMFPGVTVVIEENAHIGHGAIVHGAQIGKNVLVGMNAVIMDKVRIGDSSIIGALTMVPTGMDIPERKVVMGSPAKIMKEVSEEMLKWKMEGTRLYQKLAKECSDTLVECEPLTEGNENASSQDDSYKTWKETKGKDSA